jgi:hypothetical protein
MPSKVPVNAQEKELLNAEVDAITQVKQIRLNSAEGERSESGDDGFRREHRDDGAHAFGAIGDGARSEPLPTCGRRVALEYGGLGQAM